MTTFGFSAFLKLISMNDKPMRTEIRNRLVPGTGGYDFHRSLRLHTRRYLVRGESLADLLASAEGVAKDAERKSLKAGLEKLGLWRSRNPGAILNFAPSMYRSPRGIFQVHFEPDFGIQMAGGSVGIHVWNTLKPNLDAGRTYLALALLADAYDAGDTPDDVAVLSLHEPRLYRLSEVTERLSVAERMAGELEEKFDEVRDDLGLPPAPPAGPRPHR